MTLGDDSLDKIKMSLELKMELILYSEYIM